MEKFRSVGVLGSLGSFLLEAGLQILGKTNEVLGEFLILSGSVCLCFSIWLFIKPFIHLNRSRKRQRTNLIPDQPKYMSAYEAAHYMADLSDWGKKTKDYRNENGGRKHPLLETIGEFKENAQQGKIRAFGRLNGEGTHVAIPENYWMSATLNAFSITNPTISETAPAAANSDGIMPFKNVKILRSDVETVWPCSS